MSRRGTCVLPRRHLSSEAAAAAPADSMAGRPVFNRQQHRCCKSCPKFQEPGKLANSSGRSLKANIKSCAKAQFLHSQKNCGLHYETSVNIWTMNIELDFLMAAQPHNDNTELLWLPYPYLKDMHACMSSRFFGCWHARWVAYTISLSVTQPKPVFHCINMYSTQHCRSLLFRF